MPSGAFYAFVNVEGTIRTSKEVEDLLLEEAALRVWTEERSANKARGICGSVMQNSSENLQEALERIRKVAGCGACVSCFRTRNMRK
jgi:aspartate/methionine/tyrosine aminotransferase